MPQPVARPAEPAVAEAAPAHPIELDPTPTTSPQVVEAAAQVGSIRRLTEASHRPDLAARLTAAQERIERPPVPIAVVGQFKVGKSRFVNAVVNVDLCPSHPLIGSVVPTAVRYGTPPEASAHLTDGSRETIDHTRLDEWVSEDKNRGNRRHVRQVEALVPRRYMETGLQLIDTPGLGGLDSPAGRLLEQTVSTSAGLLLLTSALQELTKPEIDFLSRIRTSVTSVAVVITKIDLTANWRRIVQLNAEHLHRAGFDVDIFPLSSALRARAARLKSPDVNDESGFPPLLTWMHEVVNGTAEHEARQARRVLRDATAQLRSAASIAEKVAAAPEQATAVQAQLDTVAKMSAELTGDDADWRNRLDASLRRARSQVDGALDQGLHTVVMEAQTVLATVESGFWPEFESWIRQEATSACITALDSYADRLAAIEVELRDAISGAGTIEGQGALPSTGSMSAQLMVSDGGRLLIAPLAASTPSPSGGDQLANERRLALNDVHDALDMVRDAMAELTDAAADEARAIIESQIEAQGADISHAAEATANLVQEVAAQPHAVALSLADLRAQLDGLDSAIGGA